LTQIEQVVAALKSQILSGRLKPGLRLMEVRIAEELGVSRTPVRLALSWLEREGLVYTTGLKRGFIVREFDPAEVFGAIEIRGCLEGMAARLSAEIGCTPEMEQRFLSSLEQGDALLTLNVDSVDVQKRWVAYNVEFHSVLVQASRNRTLCELTERLNSLPLVSPAAISFAIKDPGGDMQRFFRTHDDHRSITAAILERQGLRAEMLVREHAYRNIQNKKRNFRAIKEHETADSLPGIDLVLERPPARRRKRRARKEPN
jgi:GntR family transcriptional regulator of vanillate catabolism